MSSRDLNDLRDDVHSMSVSHKQLCKAAGIDLLIYCTLRPDADQAALYAIGRTIPGKKVTNARAGESNHNPDKDGKSRAYDCCPLRYGKPVWSAKSKEDAALWAEVGRIGESVGLAWAGRWAGNLKELCHFEKGGV